MWAMKPAKVVKGGGAVAGADQQKKQPQQRKKQPQQKKQEQEQKQEKKEKEKETETEKEQKMQEKEQKMEERERKKQEKEQKKQEQHGKENAAVQRKRGAAAGKSNGRARTAVGAAAPAPVKKADAAAAASAAVYESDDSFEHHVIDLRDDQYRSPNATDESEVALRDAQNSEELSVDNGNAREESGSDMDAAHPNGHGPLLNGKTYNRKRIKKGHNGVDEGANGGPVRPSKHSFLPGQLVWAKYARFPWWPALVMDQGGTLEGKGGTPSSETDLLVRFFGTYDYGWVDPFANLSDFEVKLTERSRLRKKALQKGVEEALEFRSSQKLPGKWEPQNVSPTSQSNGIEESPEVLKDSPTAEDDPKERKTPRKRKPKVLFEEEEGRIERKPQRMLRRLRVMRQLGLVAPAGSPFTADYD